MTYRNGAFTKLKGNGNVTQMPHKRKNKDIKLSENYLELRQAFLLVYVAQSILLHNAGKCNQKSDTRNDYKTLMHILLHLQIK